MHNPCDACRNVTAVYIFKASGMMPDSEHFGSLFHVSIMHGDRQPGLESALFDLSILTEEAHSNGPPSSGCVSTQPLFGGRHRMVFRMSLTRPATVTTFACKRCQRQEGHLLCWVSFCVKWENTA